MAMIIYHAERKGRADWDEYEGFVLIAPNKRRAIKVVRDSIQASHRPYTEEDVERDFEISKLGTPTNGAVEGIVISDFRAD